MEKHIALEQGCAARGKVHILKGYYQSSVGAHRLVYLAELDTMQLWLVDQSVYVHLA